MNTKFRVFYFVLFTFLYSCSNNLEKKMAKKWSVVKMEKMVSVTSNSYTPIKIDTRLKLSYDFLSDNNVKLITQTGSSINGYWNVKDSIINMIVKKDKKKFKIIKLTDTELILTAGKFKFYLEN